MSAELLAVLIRMTLVFSVAIASVLVLRVAARRYVGPRLAYALWLAVPLLPLATLMPAPRPAPIVVRLASHDRAVAAAAAAPKVALPMIDTAAWWLELWLAGALASVCALVVQQRRFVRSLGTVRAGVDGVYRASSVAGCPALIGLARPRIVVPADFDMRYDVQQRALVLAHERTHLARGDVWANAFAAAVRCMAWFNPIAHVAARYFRFDQELACDASVIARFPNARRSYADAMLKTQLADLGLPVGCHWQSSHSVRERILMLKRTTPSLRRRATGTAVGLALCIAGSYFAWAAQPPFPNARDALEVNMTTSIDDGDIEQFHLSSAFGQRFAVESRKGVQNWQLAMVTEPRGDDTILVHSELMHGSAVVSRSSLIVRENENFAIGFGIDEDDNGHFNSGYRANVTLARANPPAVVPTIEAPTLEQPFVVDIPDHGPGYGRISPIAYPADESGDGVVFVRARVNSDGTVDGDSTGADGAASPAFAQAATSSVKTWTFDPAVIAGKAVASDVVVPVVFADHTPNATAMSAAHRDDALDAIYTVRNN